MSAVDILNRIATIMIRLKLTLGIAKGGDQFSLQ